MAQAQRDRGAAGPGRRIGCGLTRNAAMRCAAPYTRRPNHDHRQLPRLRHHYHRHHPKPQPPLLLATLPKSRLASTPPRQDGVGDDAANGVTHDVDEPSTSFTP